MLLKKLIIAEDDEDTAFLISTALGDAGFLCLRARNGEEALNLARTEQPDIMLLDVMMPRMDGLQVCRAIKGDVMLSRIPILMLTSMADVQDRVNGLEAGADDYLPKPFDIRELAARVNAAIRSSRRERERNPVTNLPSGEAVEDHVNQLLRDKKEFALLYLDIENFRSFADVYGYRRADDVVAHTGKLILRHARTVASPPPFVGHVGGDDFIVAGDREPLSAMKASLIDVFAQEIAPFYSDEDRERGYLSVPGEEGRARVSFMTPSIAEVPVAPGQFKNSDELAREVTRTKQNVRRRTRSGLFPSLDLLDSPDQNR